MTVYFAAAHSVVTPTLAQIFITRQIDRADNDNEPETSDSHLLHAALRHFAKHGLAAATEARKQAEKAFFAGDRENYDWWLAICRSLDRRMADTLVKSHEYARIST